ncbi:glycosyltransferase family 32 protein [Leifsonia sp. NPDC056824]|uniref:glycosyltransferase family 32 protein n=1 Tax=Leifsonia sp. NPDC056824 TaxID=3345953 RepID=UPI0036827271
MTIEQISRTEQPADGEVADRALTIPRTLVRYWHDPQDIPEDVARCLASWAPLQDEGIAFRFFGDASARAYISERFDAPTLAAFERCHHPAMRSDFFRMCFVLAEGGLYVDADDVLLGSGWREVFEDHRLLVQPLAYDTSVNGMVQAEELRNADLPTHNRIFYVNNNPIASPPHHPVMQRALDRAMDRLLRRDSDLEIQSTTGPGNLTASLAAHARNLAIARKPADFLMLLNWHATAEPHWDLEYRNDDRNWRNIRPR